MFWAKNAEKTMLFVPQANFFRNLTLGAKKWLENGFPNFFWRGVNK